MLVHIAIESVNFKQTNWLHILLVYYLLDVQVQSAYWFLLLCISFAVTLSSAGVAELLVGLM
jgi:hypothetical protein